MSAFLRKTFAVLAAVLSAAVASAAPPPSVCSPPAGTIGMWQGEAVTCVADRTQFNSCHRRFVSREGVWAVCRDWVADGGDPYMPEPPPAVPCSARSTYERWGGAQGDLCSSQPPGVSSAPDLHILPAAPHGARRPIYDLFGNSLGVQDWRCEQGRWVLAAQTCGVVNATDPAPAPTPKPKTRAGDAKVGATAPRPGS